MASPLNRVIVAGMTDALHGWAVVQCEQKEGRRLSAADCPPAASKACRAARVLTKAIEEENGMSLDALLVRACEADRHPEEEARFAPMFGAMLVHMALGTGLSWFDDHARFPLRVPPAVFGYAGSEEYRASKHAASKHAAPHEPTTATSEEAKGKKAKAPKDAGTALDPDKFYVVTGTREVLSVASSYNAAVGRAEVDALERPDVALWVFSGKGEALGTVTAQGGRLYRSDMQETPPGRTRGEVVDEAAERQAERTRLLREIAENDRRKMPSVYNENLRRRLKKLDASIAASAKPNPRRAGSQAPPVKNGHRATPAYPATRPPTISSQRFLDPVVVQDKIRDRKFAVHYVNATAPNGKKFRVITDGHHRLAAAAHERVAPKFVHDTKAQKTADRLGKRYLPDHKRDADWYDVRTERRVRVSS